MDFFTDFLRSLSGSQPLYDVAEASRARSDAAIYDALGLQRNAAARAERAAVPVLDRESTRLAGEAQLRKLLAAAGARFTNQPLGAAPLGFTTLMGE